MENRNYIKGSFVDGESVLGWCARCVADVKSAWEAVYG